MAQPSPVPPSAARPPLHKLILLVLLHFALCWACLFAYAYVSHDEARVLIVCTIQAEVLLLICLMHLSILPRWQVAMLGCGMLLLVWGHSRVFEVLGIVLLILFLLQISLVIAWGASFRESGGTVIWIDPKLQTQTSYTRITLRHIFAAMLLVSVLLGILQNPWVNHTAHRLSNLAHDSILLFGWAIAGVILPACLLFASLHLSLRQAEVYPRICYLVPLVLLNSLIWIPILNPPNLYLSLLASTLQTALFLCTWLELRISGYRLHYRKTPSPPPDELSEQPIPMDELS